MDPVQDDYDMARRLGFREPPDAVSMSCLTYMGRIMELRNFIGMFFSLVKSSQAIKKQLDEAVGSEQMPGSAIWRTFNYHHADYEQLIGELVISRAIETFDLYLISILREIFVSKPEMLKSEGKIDVSEVIDLKNFEDIIARIVERKLHDLSYRPLNDLQAYIGKVTGISLFESRDIFDLVLVASEIRNLIAHNDCCINDIFRSRVKGADVDYSVSEKGKVDISDEWVRIACYTLDGVVFRFDEAVCRKYRIGQRNSRMAFHPRP